MFSQSTFVKAISRKSPTGNQSLPFWAGLLLVMIGGCASRPHGWGFPAGQGTIERQRARATVHDPYPLNDIGPEVAGGRPREFFNPQAEPVRQHNVEILPNSFKYGR